MLRGVVAAVCSWLLMVIGDTPSTLSISLSSLRRFFLILLLKTKHLAAAEQLLSTVTSPFGSTYVVGPGW